MHGHVWTIGPRLRHVLSPAAPPASIHWTGRVADPALGSVRLTGRLRRVDGRRARDLLIVVHGLGGNAFSHYTVEAAIAAERAGLSCLRLNLRGADRRGEDFYHAAQVEDLAATVADSALARFEKIYLLGYSIGGHISLRYVAEGADHRVAAVAALCPPLDLSRSAKMIDRPERTLYRYHVLRGLKEMYEVTARRRPVPIPWEAARRITTIREWDERVVAPRHGFAGADDYWRRASVAPWLRRIRRPALLVCTARDPMVLAHTVRPALDGVDTVEKVWLDRGGHVGFPGRLDLGLGGGAGAGRVEDQVIAWLGRS
jgi:predicted alpha/beta-fold hydrolase